ncbi:MAG: DUF4428 domain-containing protein [Clostridia bacterium]|nr:DUF4428 domain-containing protein [Clostridia bacterium]
MAKHTCAICGAELNLLTEQKLADGNYICRKVCSKRCLKYFDKVSATLDSVKSHIEQVEYGTKVFNQIFLPLQKTKNKEEKLKRIGTTPEIVVSESTGLIALVENRYKIFIFGKTQHACVYRIADLYGYDYEYETVKNSDGKEETKHYCRLLFHNVAGLYEFRIGVAGEKAYNSVAKYFDTLFGIQKTLGNIGNTFKKQMNAIKAVAGAINAVKEGNVDETVAEETVEALDVMQYGDRTRWIEKADAALASVQK